MNHYATALRIAPDLATAHRAMGAIREQGGDSAEAVKHYTAAIKSDQGDIATKNNLAWILATHSDSDIRDGPRALRLAREVCHQVGKDRPELLDTLAAANAEAGQYVEAARIAKKALQLANRQGQSAMVREIQQRLRSYEAGRPFRAL